MKEIEYKVSQEDFRRGRLLELVKRGESTLEEVTPCLGVCYRQAKRLKASYLGEGVPGLAHGNRGRAASNRITEEVREKVLRLSEEKYSKFNDSHFTEKLNEQEGLKISRETVRSIRRGASIKPKRRRRAKRHYKRRERKPCRGIMMQWDGSPHRWLGDGHRPCCLMAAVDDADKRLLAARFEPVESSAGYLRLLKQVVETHGIPTSVYQDGHSCLYRNDEHWSLEEQLVGKQKPTQVGQALESLGIEPIRAHSPQAKGRIERTFQTLQDRFIAEMSLFKFQTLEEANLWLQQEGIQLYNDRFVEAPQKRNNAFREVGRRDLDRDICFRYEAIVGNDNAIRMAGLVIDIPPGPARKGYAKAKVKALQLLDGSWRIYYKDELIATHDQTPLRSPIPARTKRKTKGTQEWNWVYMASAPGDETLASTQASPS